MKKATGLDNIRKVHSLEKLRKCLYSIKVIKNDAIQMEKKVFKDWSESCEVNEITKIPIESIDAFLDDMQTLSKGITDDKKTEMRSILTDTSDQNVVEWDFTRPDNSGAQYGIVTIGKNPNGMFVDCFHVVFKMEFTIASKESKTSKVCKFIKTFFPKTDEVPITNPLEQISSEDFQNFCRHKVLEHCFKEGYIDRISFDNPPEGCSTLPEVPSKLALENGSPSPKSSHNKKKKMNDN